MIALKMVIPHTLLSIAYAAIAICVPTFSVGPSPWYALLAVWPSLSHLSFSALYLAPYATVGWIGKDIDSGSMAILPTLWFFPPHLVQWLTWAIRHTTCIPLKGEHPYDRVGPSGRIYVGRYPMRYPSEFPVDDCSSVVDLTAEFPARDAVINGRTYLCLPSLDCEMPPRDELLKLARRVADMRGKTYVHCANGHGRSACLAALVLMIRGEATGWRDAFVIMRKTRPQVNIYSPQENMLQSIEDELARKRLLPAREAAMTRAVRGADAVPHGEDAIELSSHVAAGAAAPRDGSTAERGGSAKQGQGPQTPPQVPPLRGRSKGSNADSESDAGGAASPGLRTLLPHSMPGVDRGPAAAASGGLPVATSGAGRSRGGSLTVVPAVRLDKAGQRGAGGRVTHHGDVTVQVSARRGDTSNGGGGGAGSKGGEAGIVRRLSPRSHASPREN